MKKNVWLAAALACSAMWAVPAMAEAVTEAEEVEAEVAENLDTVWNNVVYGEYTGVYEEEGSDEDASLYYEDITLLPGGIADCSGMKVPYTIDGDQVVIDVSVMMQDGMEASVVGTFAPIGDADLGDVNPEYYEIAPEDMALFVDVVMKVTDNSNPMAGGKEEVYTSHTVFAKSSFQDDFAEMLLTAYDWDLNGNSMHFEDDKVSMNDGAAEGSWYAYASTSYLTALEFSWDSGSYPEYYFSDITEDSISIVNLDDETEELTLTITGGAAAPADEEAMTE